MASRSETWEISLWRDAADLILSAPCQSEGLKAVTARVLGVLEAASCAFYLLDHGAEELALAALAGSEVGVPRNVRPGQGIIGLCAYQRRAIRVAHAPCNGGERSDGGGRDDRWSMLAVPVQQGEQLLGVLAVRRGGSAPFADEDLHDLERVVQPVIVLLMGYTSMQQRLQRRTYELQTLNELGQALNAGLGLDETLELIATQSVKTLNAGGAVVRLVVDDGTLALGTMVAARDTSFDSNYERRVAEYVATSGEPLVIDDVHTSRAGSVAGGSMVCVPLVVEERVVGTLSLLSRKPTPADPRGIFGFEDLDMLFGLSSQIAAQIEDIRLTGRLQELVRTEKQQGEALRELYNRSRALLQSISDGLVAINPDGTIQEINAVAARILGITEEDLRGRPVDELVQDQPSVESSVQSGDQFSNRVVTLRSREGPVAAMANLQPVMDDGRIAGGVLTFREMKEVGRFVNRMIGARRTFTFSDIIGNSLVIEQTKDVARTAAGTASTILIQGETGTGKEVLAQSIHNASSFSDGPFLGVNCAAIPRDLIESELFGYAEGAFTGARRKGHLGKFELASGGTLFLDEIGDIPLEVQIKLLRVLQERTIVRVGGDRTIPINCRLIAATNRDLQAAVAEGRFRRDVLYRINVISIELPPLRERREDIPLFVEHFLRVCAERNGKIVDGVSAAAARRLNAYPWPGNVRELENAIEHAVAMVRGRIIGLEDLPVQIRNVGDVAESETRNSDFEVALHEQEAATRNLYVAALKREGGDVLGAAQLLGVSRATLYRRLKKHGLQREVAELRHMSQN